MKTKVRNLKSPRTGAEVANQFIITVGNKEIFQSYNSVIAVKKDGRVTLDKNYWDYSTTTGKYRNQFLGENKAETQSKIESKEYRLRDLN